MTDAYVSETYMPAATASGVSRGGATTAVGERQTVIPDTIPRHSARVRPAGEPYERRREPDTPECPVLPDIQPGQVWVVEHTPADLHLSPLARRPISAANVVIYDRALYAIVAANLPLGGYAEPASSPDRLLDMPIDRCLQFARDGWSVVWLADHRTRREERIGRLVDRMITAGCSGFTPVTLFVTGAGEMPRQTQTELCRLGALVAGKTREGALAIAFGAVGAGAAPHLHAISTNGLAG